MCVLYVRPPLPLASRCSFDCLALHHKQPSIQLVKRRAAKALRDKIYTDNTLLNCEFNPVASELGRVTRQLRHQRFHLTHGIQAGHPAVGGGEVPAVCSSKKHSDDYASRG